MNDTMTSREAQEALSLGHRQVNHLIHTGQLAATRDGWRWRIDRASVAAYKSAVPKTHITVQRAALIIGCTRRHVGKLIAARKVKASKIHGRWWVSRTSAQRYARTEHKPGPKPKHVR